MEPKRLTIRPPDGPRQAAAQTDKRELLRMLGRNVRQCLFEAGDQGLQVALIGLQTTSWRLWSLSSCVSRATTSRL